MNREKWIAAMHGYYGEDQPRIDHALKVLEHAEEILAGEHVDDDVKPVTVATAIFHDIGIPEAIRKYGTSSAPYQEQEGAPIARQMLLDLGEPAGFAERVAYIVGHHHTHDKIDGPDFQIIWEADLLVNLQKREHVLQDRAHLREVIERNFRTDTGRRVAERVYLSN